MLNKINLVINAALQVSLGRPVSWVSDSTHHYPLTQVHQFLQIHFFLIISVPSMVQEHSQDRVESHHQSLLGRRDVQLRSHLCLLHLRHLGRLLQDHQGP